MEDPPLPIHPLHNPKKRLCTGSGSSNGESSSAYVDPDVIEIPPPPVWISNPHRRKSIVGREIIVVDEEDSDDVVIIDEKVAPNTKGKKPMINYLGSHDPSGRAGFSSSQTDGFAKRKSRSYNSVTDNDFLGMDLYNPGYDDELAMLQAHFNSIDIPSGVEATVPWWPTSVGGGTHTVSTSSSSVYGPQWNTNISISKPDQFQPWGFAGPIQAKMPIGHPPSSGFYKQTQTSGPVPEFPHWAQLSQTSGLVPKVPHWAQQSLGPKVSGPSSKKHSLPPVLTSSLPFSQPSQPLAAPSAMSHFGPGFPRTLLRPDDIAAQISPLSASGRGDVSETAIMKRLEDFQRFDSVEDFSGHRFESLKDSCNQPKTWKKKVFAEWDMLKNDLPETIFVRIYESRMDLLRAAIIGAEGTPYHNGIFFFDIYLPDTYPAVPPQVHHHSHGERINPNLYVCGKVCLSLLNTWTGHGVEKWRPNKSNMLQVLVSIQGLILNAEPYCNEPGFSHSKYSAASKSYSENTFLLSLKIMLHTMRNPPKYFEDLVYGHFYKRAHDILAACRAYLNGVQVGTFVKGKNHDAKTTPNPCSPILRDTLPGYIKSLVEAFTKIGVKECDKFLAPVGPGANHLWKHGPY